ncbi:Chromosomal replication initiator protein DnaA [Frankliniella fusca]|uniref:Chromosomal replication initiator protein DnaA n=1 Tax=Frankliniella fusca TaxID=407009 RepID=A0AAE1GSQ5_9NEOP|nr:Chromosomal replication initiator protein DnaA [Frankliniella fusca]
MLSEHVKGNIIPFKNCSCASVLIALTVSCHPQDRAPPYHRRQGEGVSKKSTTGITSSETTEVCDDAVSLALEENADEYRQRNRSAAASCLQPTSDRSAPVLCNRYDGKGPSPSPAAAEAGLAAAGSAVILLTLAATRVPEDACLDASSSSTSTPSPELEPRPAGGASMNVVCPPCSHLLRGVRERIKETLGSGVYDFRTPDETANRIITLRRRWEHVGDLYGPLYVSST